MPIIDLVRGTKIEQIVQESSNIRSLYFKDLPSLNSSPGQFLMVWLPGAGEFPMSLSLPSKNGLASIGVKPMGMGSSILFESEIGDYLGIRGPYGNSFDLEREKAKRTRVLLVGGGTGMLPMAVLAKALSKTKASLTMIISARTKAELPLLSVSKKIVGSKNIFPTTDDGSFGFKGLAHEQVRELVSKYKFDEIFSCGPEKMMAQVFQIARDEKIPVQFSLERIMKCGMGICGSCVIGDRVLCKDGPIVHQRELEKLETEFGNLHRDKSGNLCPI